MFSSVLPTADASRPRSGILTPTSDGSLNRNDGEPGSSENRKGKRADSAAMDHLLKPAIALKPHPPNLHVQPRVLQPLVLLPREHLPLSCLDLNDPQGHLPPSRLYESHIKILDLESRMGSAPRVLIARSESKGTFYVLERHDNGLYTTCKLGSWVSMESLARHAIVACRERIWPPEAEPTDSKAPSAMTTPQTHKDQKKKKVAIEAIQSLVRKGARSQSISTLDELAKPDGPANSHTEHPALPSSDDKPTQPTEPTLPDPVAPVVSTNGDAGQQQTAESIFDNIRTQYFEALYRSKGSLAYFAKGPLSRARSAFHLDLESSLDMNDLIEFLKGLILSTVQVDRKYRETIPGLVSKLRTTLDSSDEGRKKRRRPKKMKLGKDSLYPLEDESIQSWWAANKPEPNEDDDSGVSMQQIKAHASLLRTRETQLQMILIMEILALELLKPQDQSVEAGLPALPDSTESQDHMAPPPPKKRNKHNLPVLIDVHTDRLTIWQSTASDEQLLLEDSQAPSPSKNQVQQKASSEPLKDFCVDVIVPFYSSRLPQLCDSLCRKLGGPVIVSPPKPKSKSKSVKRSSSKQEQKPGAAARRTALRKEPRTLERALSFEQQHRRSVSRGPSQIMDLMRATSTALPPIKREESDPANLKGMAKAGSRENRPSMSRSSSMAGLEDGKTNKKAKIDAELRDAISNLRKPNREVVGQAMEEAAERKASTVLSTKKSRKGVKPVANSGVQVKATPANNRFKNAMGPKPEVSEDVPLPSTEEIIPPSSIGPFVPSTGPRTSYHDVLQNSASPATDTVGNTPLKPPAGPSFLRKPAAEEPAVLPSSPPVARQVAPFDSPVVPASAVKSRHNSGLNNVPETPIKKSAPPRPSGNDQDEQREKRTSSIYQRLGWDDDDLDDLL